MWKRAGEGGPDLLLGPEIEMDAASVIAVEWLDHAWEAEAFGDGGRLGGRGADVASRDGESGTVQESIGQALVGRDVDADRAGLRRHRRPDPLLVDAVPELDERMAVESDERDVAADGFIDQRLCRRAERLALGQADQPLELVREVEEMSLIVGCDEVVDESDGHLACLEPDRLFLVLVDAVVL